MYPDLWTKLARRPVQALGGGWPACFNPLVTAGGRLTTHVLDVARGRPAEGVGVELFAVGDGARDLLATAETNHHGRTDAPLAAGGALREQTYECAFTVGPYLVGSGLAATPPFFDVVAVRFTVTDAGRDHHVPLLLTPWSYTVYRGS